LPSSRTVTIGCRHLNILRGGRGGGAGSIDRKRLQAIVVAIVDEALLVHHEAAVARIIGLPSHRGLGGEEAVTVDRDIERRTGLFDRAERKILADRFDCRADALR
jgi:hypothetical protein